MSQLEMSAMQINRFEAWAKDNLGQGYSLEREEGVYIDRVTRWAFIAYTAGACDERKRLHSFRFEPPHPDDRQQPRRITLSRAKGWKMPPNTVKVDRTTKWGNPWKIGEPGPLRRIAPDAAGAVGLFTAMLVDPEMQAAAEYPGDLTPLRGKNLACWCKPGEPCHADVLLGWVNYEAAHIDIERMERALASPRWTVPNGLTRSQIIRFMDDCADGKIEPDVTQQGEER